MKQHLLYTLLFSLPFSFLCGQIPFTEVFNEIEDVNIDEMISADFNGDQIPDYVLTSYSQDEVFVSITAVPFSNNSLTAIATDFDTRRLQTGDVDNDGDIDILGAAPFDDQSFIWINDGSGDFQRLLLNTEIYGSLVHDINNDNINELVLVEADGIGVYTFENEALMQVRVIGGNVDFNSNTSLTLHDNNGDELVDLAAGFGLEGIRIFEQSANGSFTISDPELGLSNISTLVSTDLEGDGDSDFLAHDDFSGVTYVVTWEMTGYTIVELPSDARNERSNFGDIDNDGDLDIIYVEADFGSAAEVSLLVNEAGVFTEQILTNSYRDIEAVNIVDIDNDNDGDIAIYTTDFFNEGFLFYENTSLPASTDKLEEAAFSVYPTITSTDYIITSPAKFQYQIFDQVGRKIAEGPGQGYLRIDCSNWASGVYYTRITINQASKTVAVIKI